MTPKETKQKLQRITNYLIEKGDLTSIRLVNFCYHLIVLEENDNRKMRYMYNLSNIC